MWPTSSAAPRRLPIGAHNSEEWETSEQHYDANQGAVPPPQAPSQSPTPPSTPSNPQYAADPAADVPQTGVTFTPMSDASHRRIKRIVVGAVALVAVVIVGTIALTVANWTSTPEAKVRQYLDLLADGKASAATAMVDPGLPDDQRGFLSDKVMASASARIEVEDVTVDDEENSKERVVTATMRLDGERFSRSFRVSEGKKTFGLLPNWKIENAMIDRVFVEPRKVTHFSIGGEKMSVATLTESSSGSIVLYPGVYTITPEETGEYIDAEPQTLSVRAMADFDSSHTGARVYLEGTYNDKMAAAALEAAVALTESCATVSGRTDTACPGAINSRPLSFLEVKTMPTTVEVADGGVYFAEATYTIQGTLSGSKRHDMTFRVTAKLKTDKDGIPELDASGKPQFEVRF